MGWYNTREAITVIKSFKTRTIFLGGMGERANGYRSFPDTYRGVSAG